MISIVCAAVGDSGGKGDVARWKMAICRRREEFVVGTIWRNGRIICYVLMWLELVTGTVEAVVAAVTTTTGGVCLA